MKLNVNYREISRIGSSVENKAIDLNRKINELIVLINNFGDCWEGNDCSIFINNSTTYLKNRKSDVVEVKRVGALIKKSSGLYNMTDVEWKEVVSKEEEFDNV
ncbi:MAG: hypothetical protein ACI4XM_06510 [Candidatus Coprovivens sp.]